MTTAALAQKVKGRPDVATERLMSLTRSLIGSLKPNTEAYAFALGILEAVNQTETCVKCEGRGTRDRHIECHHDTHDRFVLNCYGQVTCKACHGIGRVAKT